MCIFLIFFVCTATVMVRGNYVHFSNVFPCALPKYCLGRKYVHFSCVFVIVSCKLKEAGSPYIMEARSWKLEVGSCKLKEAGSKTLEF